jgi:hypothetical protein
VLYQQLVSEAQQDQLLQQLQAELVHTITAGCLEQFRDQMLADFQREHIQLQQQILKVVQQQAQQLLLSRQLLSLLLEVIMQAAEQQAGWHL